MVIGRFAPKPKRADALGNVFSALLAWLSVRSAGGKMILRIEDLDPDRCRPEYATQLRRDLEWLGLDWDEEQTPQSQRTEAYAEAFAKAGHLSLLCSRNELHAARPRTPPTGAVIYAGTCRDLTAAERAAKTRRPAWRARAGRGSFVCRRFAGRSARKSGAGVRRFHPPPVGRRLRLSAGRRRGRRGGVTEIVRGGPPAVDARQPGFKAARPAASALLPCAAALRRTDAGSRSASTISTSACCAKR